MMMWPDNLPFRILICDGDATAVGMLSQSISRVDASIAVEVCQSLDELLAAISRTIVGAIFIDPFAFELGAAADTVFQIRESHPWIAFILYIDVAAAERRRADFYRGRRSRFSHYYRLDKTTPLLAFDGEVASIVTLVRRWAWKRLSRVTGGATTASAFDNMVIGGRALAKATSLPDEPLFKPNSVFLSHRFAETEFVEGLEQLLEKEGFDVIKGDSANTFVSQAVLQRIKQSEFVLCLITKAHEKSDGTWLTSGWILEEKGVALAFGKPLVLMVEDGVVDIGGLQGDWQRIHFTSRGFLKAALQAVKQLRSYSGR